MSRFIKAAVALLCAAASCTLLAAPPYANVGRSATPQEVAAWDIDVRPDFKGLPKGSGSVVKGMEVWEGKCASCHGTFGESNEVFTPIVGGTTKEDVKSGRVASLRDNKQPQRTTMMKVATVSTLWDYINRAMPWTAPKTLTTEEVYAVTAYILNMAEVVPDDFVLSDRNIAEVQARMPNRNGMTQAHGMWDVKGKPDVRSTACMSNCGDVKLRSELPEAARNVHGDLAAQNRSFGAVRGVDTTQPAPRAALVGRAPVAASTSSALAVAAVSAPAPAVAKAPTGGLALAKQNACMACHGVGNKIVGPALRDIAAKYRGDAAAAQRLAGKVKAGSAGAWGPVPMPAQGHLKDEDIAVMVGWILDGAK
ncbi:cytochrome C [Massilia sp. Root351]|uniref:c-type cytochrome n=1 Tax=Massilia sp. Root351 TaxID=1736522 RepID=UPI00070E97F6|nr:c-type cytochrome [Massilia sp. Root351]KQV80910.1 cytochrome C [Massilia sp. Root351]